MKDKPGSLQTALGVFSTNGVSLASIVSRPSTARSGCVDFDISLAPNSQGKAVDSVLEELNALSSIVAEARLLGNNAGLHGTPWFPRRPADLDLFARQTMEYGEGLDADHPGFKDKEYRERRAMLAQVAKDFKHGDRIPEVSYVPNELAAWKVVYENLVKLFPTHACAAFNRVFPLFEKECQFSANRIPQLQEVSDFLKSCTGWTLRPVAGLLSQRDFLNALAFRIFHSTQYIRHHSKPLYTPEPDICHEILGHIPMLADPAFATFSQELGLASLGATDEDIVRLGTLYWFTVEFGLCRDVQPDGSKQMRAYGAGILSSFGELEYALSDKPEVRPFDPATTCTQPYPITTYQPVYYVSDSFEEMQRQMVRFSRHLHRPFEVTYNYTTSTVEVLDSLSSITQYAMGLHRNVVTLTDALAKYINKKIE